MEYFNEGEEGKGDGSRGEKKQQQHRRKHQQRRTTKPSSETSLQQQQQQPKQNNDDNDAELLKSPTQVRNEVKNLLLKAIDEAADALKKLPRISSPPAAATAPPAESPQEQSPSPSPLPTAQQKVKKKPSKSAKRSNIILSATSVSTTITTFSSTKQSTFDPAFKQPKSYASAASSASTSLSPLNPAAQKALTKPHYSKDQFATHGGRHTVTREYFTAAGDPIVSSPTKSLANPEQLNTIIIQNSGKDISGMILDFKVKLTKPDGTSRDIKLGIELPKF